MPRPLAGIASGSSIANGIFLAIGCTLFVRLAVKVWPFTPDDTFITLRYAQNLANGHGPTFNAGGAPVEGYTSFLWMLVLAVPHWFGADALFFAKAAGLAAIIGCAALVAAFTADLTRLSDTARSSAPAVAILIFASLSATAVHAVSGMETAIFTLLLLAFVAVLTRFVAVPTRARAALLGAVALLLGTTRPEGNLVILAGVLAAFFVVPGAARNQLIRWMAAIYGGGGAVYMVWRVAYYGLLFPLPFYVKVTSPSLFAGAEGVWLFCAYFGVPAGALVLLGIASAPRLLLPACAAAAALPIFFLFPAPVMNYEWRYLFPLLPIVCVLAAAGYAKLQSWMRSVTAWPRSWSTVVLFVIPVVLALRLAADAPDALAERTEYAVGLRRAHANLGNALRVLRVSNDAPVLAIGDAGAVPYYSGWRTIDTLGLNEPHIARSAFHDPEYVFRAHPDLLVLISTRPERFEPLLQWEAALYEHAVHAGMAHIAALEFKDEYYLWLMALPDGQVSRVLRSLYVSRESAQAQPKIDSR